jgi:hypothetical protein
MYKTSKTPLKKTSSMKGHRRKTTGASQRYKNIQLNNSKNVPNLEKKLVIQV